VATKVSTSWTSIYCSYKITNIFIYIYQFIILVSSFSVSIILKLDHSTLIGYISLNFKGLVMPYMRKSLTKYYKNIKKTCKSSFSCSQSEQEFFRPTTTLRINNARLPLHKQPYLQLVNVSKYINYAYSKNQNKFLLINLLGTL
jgi:phosphoenolpyruvate carboxylase